MDVCRFVYVTHTETLIFIS